MRRHLIRARPCCLRSNSSRCHPKRFVARAPARCQFCEVLRQSVLFQRIIPCRPLNPEMEHEEPNAMSGPKDGKYRPNGYGISIEDRKVAPKAERAAKSCDKPNG